jgi:hypothetical protein
VTAARGRPPASPPDPGHADAERLVSYLRAELPGAEADLLREHLTTCRECIELLLDLEAFERGGAAAAADGAERAASWRRLLAVRPWERTAGGADEGDPAAGGAGAAAEPPAERPPARRRWRPSPRTALGARVHPGLAALLAASLAATAGLAVWSFRLERRLSAPRPDQPIVELLPSATTRGGGPHAQGELWRVPQGASFTLIIVPDVDERFPRYEAAILDAGGDALWRGLLTPDAESEHVTLGLSRRLLAGRRYTIALRGVDGERRAEAGAYVLEFAPEPAD